MRHNWTFSGKKSRPSGKVKKTIDSGYPGGNVRTNENNKRHRMQEKQLKENCKYLLFTWHHKDQMTKQIALFPFFILVHYE
jgi:hypothetical protein